MFCSFLQAVSYLLQGEIVAFPTDTVYGLGLSMHRGSGEKLFNLKQRDPKKPLVIYVNDISMIETIIHRPLSQAERSLMDSLFLKPITIIVPNSNPFFSERKLGFRIINHPVVQSLVHHIGPLLATSANLSDAPSAISANDVLEDFNNSVAILKGDCLIGLESTVLDTDPLCIYREGGVSQKEIEACLGKAVPVIPSSPKCYSKHLQIHTFKKDQDAKMFISNCKESFLIETSPKPLQFYPILRKAIREQVRHLIFIYDDTSSKYSILKPFLSPFFNS